MTPAQRTYNLSPLYALGLVFLCLTPWLVLQYNLRIPADAAFLFSGASMMLEGKSMSEYYFDNNPPMSFMIYIPAALLHAMAGLAKHDAIQIYTLSMIGTSSLFTALLLSRWPSITTIQSFAILCAYTAVLCLFANKEFGQKDHLLAIALFPFALAQLTTLHQADKGIKLPSMIMLLLTPFILLKPHYLILPSALILYRLYKTSFIKTLLATDVWLLGIATVAYMVAIHIVTPDFTTIILPNALKLYVSSAMDMKQLKIGIAFLGFTAFLIFYAIINTNKTELSTLSVFVSIAACLTVIPFIVQNKGFSLHLLPCLTFIAAALCLNALIFIEENATLPKYTTYTPPLLLLIALYSFFISAKPIPNKKLYQTTSTLTALLKEKAGNESFLFESGTTNIFHTHALYLDNDIGSRFPNFWFFSNFDKKTHDTQKEVWQTFGKLLAEDLNRYKPQLIGLIATERDDEGFLAFFGSHPDFQDEWANYKYDGKFILDTDEFASSLFKETSHVTYDIYVRKN